MDGGKRQYGTPFAGARRGSVRMRLVLDARARRLLKRFPAFNVYSAAELLLMAGLAVQSARLVWALVTPVGPLGDWRPAEPAVPGSPSALIASFDPFFRVTGAAAARPSAVTSLQLKLFGTRIDEASGRGSAIIAGPDGVQQSVPVGTEIVSGVKLKSVAFDHVTIDRGGTAEDLYLDQSGTVPATPGAVAPTGPGALPAPAATTLADLRAAMTITPRLDGGRLSGLVVSPQGPAFAAAGLRQGDVVTAINGRPVTGPGDLERVAAELRGGGTLQLGLERQGQPTSIAVAIAPTP
jgi:general secretion pathway protein C